MKKSENFPNFIGWAEGYAVLTYSYTDKDKLINYVRSQQSHHKIESFEEEYWRLLKEHNIKIGDLYFLK